VSTVDVDRRTSAASAARRRLALRRRALDLARRAADLDDQALEVMVAVLCGEAARRGLPVDELFMD
jgi:hypothetical protein